MISVTMMTTTTITMMTMIKRIIIINLLDDIIIINLLDNNISKSKSQLQSMPSNSDEVRIIVTEQVTSLLSTPNHHHPVAQ